MVQIYLDILRPISVDVLCVIRDTLYLNVAGGVIRDWASEFDYWGIGL